MYESMKHIQDLVARKIPEGPSLEYKADLKLDRREQRLEMLKDLTGMGNGGGGTLVYGVEEGSAGDGVPAALSPLGDRGIVGVLEDVVRSSVRPPLLMTFRILEADGGFVLVVDVLRSPLGPYMIESYGESRYFTRAGTRTAPMGEQQVRDSYTLAARSRSRRRESWQEHSLPIRAETAEPWLTVSGLPDEPLIDLLDLASLPVGDLRPPEEMRTQAQMGGFDSCTLNLRLWADGVYGDDRHDDKPPTSVFRIHRDGAAALAISMHPRLQLAVVARALNAQIVYLAWLWTKLGLRTPIEIQARVEHLAEASIGRGFAFEERRIMEPAGVPVPAIGLTRELLSQDLMRAPQRHGFVRDFSDRLHQAFGYATGSLLFETGWLYGQHGKPLGFSIGGSGIWDRTGGQRAYVYESGRVCSYYRDLEVIGYLVDGVVLDEEGRAMATAEMSAGSGLPAAFVQKALTNEVKYIAPGGDAGSPLAGDDPPKVPAALGEWSTSSLPDRLEP